MAAHALEAFSLHLRQNLTAPPPPNWLPPLAFDSLHYESCASSSLSRAWTAPPGAESASFCVEDCLPPSAASSRSNFAILRCFFIFACTIVLSWSTDASPPSLGSLFLRCSGRCASCALSCASQGRMSACRTRPAANPGGPQGGAQTGRRWGGAWREAASNLAPKPNDAQW